MRTFTDIKDFAIVTVYVAVMGMIGCVTAMGLIVI